jgi:uncharacterized protein CbrC (UPF0167 family)
MISTLLHSLIVTEALPEFPYHPDPTATGSIAPSEAACACCGRIRGYIYTGPIYTAEDLGGRPCPWCIADGSVAERYDAHFTGNLVGGDVSIDVVLAVDKHTPGFTAWQEPQWLVHRGDAAAFLGLAGAAELTRYPDAIETLRQEIIGWGWPRAEIENYVNSLDKDDQPTAYLFQCRVCATHLAYSDFT